MMSPNPNDYLYLLPSTSLSQVLKQSWAYIKKSFLIPVKINLKAI